MCHERGKHVNGNLALGEAIADAGGLKVKTTHHVVLLERLGFSGWTPLQCYAQRSIGNVKIIDQNQKLTGSNHIRHCVITASERR